MPLKHQPYLLRVVALQSICQNFNKLFYRCDSEESMRTLIDTGAYMEFENPFKELPTNLLEDLASEMKHFTHLRCHHLHMFITENLEAWSFSGNIADQSMAFHMLSTRCKKLKRLDMSYLRSMNYMVVLTLIPTLANIVSLDLRMTLTVDEVVNKIGECCHSLLDLNLSSTPITDKGLVQLCVSQNGQRRCQKLSRLSVSETWISTLGASVVLYFLPNLRDFDFDNICEAVEGVEMLDERAMERLFTRAGIRLSELDTDISASAPTRLRLSGLSSTIEHLRDEALDATVRLCPNATAIAISNAWLPNESLYKLMLLEHLTSLSLTNSEGCTFTFHEGVLPVLVACGSRLNSLILTNFAGIEIAGVANSCPNLQNLAFSNVLVFELPSKLVPEWFNKLEAVELWSANSVEYSPQLVKQLLLFSPIIKNILFNSCTIVTDSLLLEIMQDNPMEMMSHFTMHHCHGVTASFINTILDANNDLAVIRVWSCESITRLHSVQISDHISEQNLDVYFEWFEFT